MGVECAKNSGTGVTGTEISGKFEILKFRNANHSTENSGNFGGKIY